MLDNDNEHDVHESIITKEIGLWRQNMRSGSVFSWIWVMPLLSFIAGGIFGSSAVLADSVHDLGDAIAIGISAFLESISNREEDSHYTLGYKRFSLLGAMVTAVILMTGSVLVILENITKLFHPQPVNDEGILWLESLAVSINVLASLVIRKGQTKNESILSLHFWKIPWAGWPSSWWRLFCDLPIGIFWIRSCLLRFLLYSVQKPFHVFGAHSRYSWMLYQKEGYPEDQDGFGRVGPCR